MPLYFNKNQTTNSFLTVGSEAPDFILPTEQGKKWRLSEKRGKVVTLLFYPQNETLICTQQMCSVRDNWENYLKTKAEIVGISPGTIDEHQSFSQNHDLPLSLLVDNDRYITKKYCSRLFLPVNLTRSVLVIDAKGIIRTRRTMFRAFRPSDAKVIMSIYAARTEAMYEEYDTILERYRKKKL